MAPWSLRENARARGGSEASLAVRLGGGECSGDGGFCFGWMGARRAGGGDIEKRAVWPLIQ